jgi:hypothetical protein
VLKNRIAFQETRYTDSLDGAVTSGPTLRTKGLDKVKFRAFLCEQIAELVRSVLRQTMSKVKIRPR